MITLEQAQRKYQGEWLAFHISKQKTNPEGEVALHKKDRQDFDKELIKLGLKNIYIVFAGPLVPEGYAVMF